MLLRNVEAMTRDNVNSTETIVVLSLCWVEQARTMSLSYVLTCTPLLFGQMTMSFD